MEELFQQKAYGWQELAILYAPGLRPHSASRRLTRWVIINKELYDRLIRSGWIKGTRILSPLQVEIIVDFLGEP
ncbi:DUF4248 domain-containing protein [Parabacteroides goldsteinii]|uniref:DUF4248 domain-containing protein n=1 Tax=Parabacteroides goldsteinii TaxID=328812 RepID=UPI002574D785|nr:DUF4248 domain-containing protein [Parabacteroides goldsteinii]